MLKTTRGRRSVTEQLKLPEVARRLDVSEKTARRYVKSGALPSVFVGGAYRVSEETVEEFLQGAKVTPGGDSPKAERRSSLELSFDDVLVEERLLRYLRVPQLHATKQSKLWAARVERRDFGEEEFQKGVDDFLDFEVAFVQGVGTDLLAALREDQDALPRAEREALDAAKASIDAWYRILWEASDILKATAEAPTMEAQSATNVVNMADFLQTRERLKERAHGETDADRANAAGA
jgi:excisionase family DNA binding protein